METFLNCLCSLKKIENVQVSPACTRSTTFFWRTNTSARFSEHAIYVFVDTELSINLFFLMNFNIYLNFLLIPSTAMFICSRPLKWQWSGDEHNVLMICIWNKLRSAKHEVIVFLCVEIISRAGQCFSFRMPISAKLKKKMMLPLNFILDVSV